MNLSSYSFSQVHAFKMSSGKWQPFCLGFNVLIIMMRIPFIAYCSSHRIRDSSNASMSLVIAKAIGNIGKPEKKTHIVQTTDAGSTAANWHCRKHLVVGSKAFTDLEAMLPLTETLEALSTMHAEALLQIPFCRRFLIYSKVVSILNFINKGFHKLCDYAKCQTTLDLRAKMRKSLSLFLSANLSLLPHCYSALNRAIVMRPCLAQPRTQALP